MGLISRLFGGWRRKPAPVRQYVRAYDRPGPTLARVTPAVPAGGDTRQPVRPAVGASREVSLAPPNEAFTPTRPKPGRRQLVGRQVELDRILQALVEEKAHVVLYSERGRGKTSLSNLAIEALRRTGATVARYTCEAGSDFDTVIRGLARDLPFSVLVSPVEGGAGEGCEAALPMGSLRPRDVAAFPGRLSARQLVCVIDEFDRIEDFETRTRLADTIKQVSDRGLPLSFMIVGVSESLDQILGQHPSIQRNVVAIHLPLLTDSDIASMLAKGGRESGLSFSPQAIVQVTVIARGMPYMAQLLGLRIAQSAFARGEGNVGDEDVSAGVERLIDDARSNVVGLYATLTDSGRDGEMVTALRRIATAEQDGYGRLEVRTAPGGVTVGRRSVSAACWARLQEAGVLRPANGSPSLFTFGDRGLVYHVLLLASRDGALLDQMPGSEPSLRVVSGLRPVRRTAGSVAAADDIAGPNWLRSAAPDID